MKNCRRSSHAISAVISVTTMKEVVRDSSTVNNDNYRTHRRQAVTTKFSVSANYKDDTTTETVTPSRSQSQRCVGNLSLRWITSSHLLLQRTRLLTWYFLRLIFVLLSLYCLHYERKTNNWVPRKCRNIALLWNFNGKEEKTKRKTVGFSGRISSIKLKSYLRYLSLQVQTKSITWCNCRNWLKGCRWTCHGKCRVDSFSKRKPTQC